MRFIIAITFLASIFSCTSPTEIPTEYEFSLNIDTTKSDYFDLNGWRGISYQFVEERFTEEQLNYFFEQNKQVVKSDYEYEIKDSLVFFKHWRLPSALATWLSDSSIYAHGSHFYYTLDSLPNQVKDSIIFNIMRRDGNFCCGYLYLARDPNSYLGGKKGDTRDSQVY